MASVAPQAMRKISILLDSHYDPFRMTTMLSMKSIVPDESGFRRLARNSGLDLATLGWRLLHETNGILSSP
jgi:hypothetical protein